LNMPKKSSLTSGCIFFVLYLPALFFLAANSFAGTDTLSRLLTVLNANTMTLFFKSAAIAALVATLSLLIGTATVVFTKKCGLLKSPTIYYLFFLPIIVPPFVYLEFLLFLSEMTKVNLFTLPIMVCLQTVIFMPIPYIIVSNGITAFEKKYEDAALLFCDSKKTFFRLIIPWLKPGFAVSFILTFLFSFSNYELPSLMNVQTYTLYIFNQFSAYYDFEKIFILLFPNILLFGFLSLFLFSRIAKGSFFRLQFENSSHLMPLSKPERTGGTIFLWLLLGIIVLPIFFLITKIEFSSAFFTQIPAFIKDIGYTITLVTLSGFGAVSFAMLYTYAIKQEKKRYRPFFLGLSIIPFAFPPACLALGNLHVSNSLTMQNTFLATLFVSLTLALKQLPIVICILFSYALPIPGNLLDAARIHEPSVLRRFFKIWVPLNGKAILQTLFVFIVLSSSEVGIMILLVPPDFMTASLNIYSMLHYGFSSAVATETSMLLVTILFSGYILRMISTKVFSGPKIST